MRYEDASHTGFSTAQANDIEARDDTDALAAGQRSAATGNVISGSGTETGATGADQNAADARIVEIAGSQGADSSFAGGRLSANGQFGTLTIDADGNYRYVANEGTPENSRDRFVYTLADNEGQRDSAAITFEIGKTQVKIQANAQQVVVGPDGVVVLPAGVQLSDIHVVGRNLVVDLPDGGQMIIIDGAVFVPQLVLGGVEVPATNLAALLVDSEPRPAAGETPPSSGGNFEVPVGPLDPGVPLGDLIPPTEMVYVPPEIREVGQFIDREPEIFVDPGNGVPVVDAVDIVSEAGLPTRNEGEPAGSGESADGNSSDNDDPNETTTGTIIYESPDDPNEITINGVVVSSVGQVIAGTYGNLTITSIADGAIGYSYTLLDNTSGNNTSDPFTIVITDNDGDTDTATLTVNIVDDVPTARPDTDSIAAGQYGPVTGNVITDASAGDAGDGDSGADTVGADNASITSVSSANVPANSDSGAPFVVSGQYGVLTLQSDGSYSYVRNAGTPGGVNDVFNYTLTDGDGDTSTTTLTISIADSPATLDAPDAGEAGTVVSEVGLPTRNEGEPAGTGEAADGNSSDNDDPSEATSGVISFTAPDGPAVVRIDGVVVTGVVGQTFAGASGTLVITSYNAAAGQIGYTYTLNDNTSGNATFDDFAITVTDQDGDVASDTLVVNIVDDAPIAVNDTDSIAAGTYGPATGNVITDAAAGDAGDSDTGKDNVGADNATVSAIASNNVPANTDNTFTAGNLVVNGQYGVLTIAADGSYSYARNPNSPGGVNDVFTYTLTDGDGDSTTATLTISIADSPATIDAPDQGEAGTVVDEQGLPTRNEGEPAGTGEAADGNSSDNDDTSEATSGVISFTAPDGPAVVRIDGVVVTGVVGQSFAGSHGTLVITSYDAGTGQIGYTYTLADNTSGNATFDDFAISVTDADGDVANDTLVVNIVDDEPIAVNDTDSIAAGQYGPATGNVITDAAAGDAGDSDNGKDNVGADNATVSAIASVNVPANTDNTFTAGNLVVNGQYGVLTIAADGSYSYVRNPDSAGGVNDVFTYTLTDGDGDTTTATLTISIADSPPTLDAPDAGEAGTVVDEQGLPTRNEGEPAGTGEAADGNSSDNDDPSEATSGVINFSSPDAPGVVRIDGVVVTGVVGQSFAGSHGTLVITSYNAATGQIGYTYTLADNTSGDATFDDFAISVTDADGDVANDTLVVNIVDDAPIAVNDTDSIAAGQFGPATGNVITDAAAGDAGDSDNGKDNVGADNASITQIASNNVPANVDNTFTAGNLVVNGQYGVLTIAADGSYSYVRNAGTPGGVNDVFTYTLTDGDGDSTTATLTISIGDSPPTLDAPDAGEAGTLVDEQGLPTRNGGEPAGTGEAADGNSSDNDDTSEATSGVINFTAPDGPAVVRIDGVIVTGVVGQSFAGTHGTLVITSYNAGTGQIGYTYTLADNTSGNATFDDFAISVTDADGDVANDTLVVNIVDDEPIAVNDTDSIAAGQYGPATGNVITDAAAGDAGDSDNGKDNVGADNATVSQIASNNIPANVDNTFTAGNLVVNGQYGVLTIAADGSYSYVRNAGTPGGVNDVFTYTLLDGDGDTTTATLTISIADSPPTLDAPDQGEAGTIVDEQGLPTRNGGEPAGTGEAADGNSSDNDDTSEATSGVINFTAPDGPAVVRIDGVIVTGVVGQSFAGTHGTLVITSYNAGTGQIGYTYTLADNTSGNATFDDFAISVTDQDGDVANDTLVVNIVDDEPIAVNDTDTVGAPGTSTTGNVITDASAGDSGDSDNGKDNVGADNATVSVIASNNVPANTDNTFSSGLLQVNGQYGVLTIAADGSYTYTRGADTPGGVNDVFTYTLLDGDGDTTTATLTITLGDSPASIDAPDEGEAGTQVSEVGLPTRNGGEPAGTGEAADGNSSDNDVTSEATTGTITFSAPDGPAVVRIDGVIVTGVPGQSFAGTHGTLVINSYNAGTGQIGYTYKLNDNTSGNATFDDFAMSVTDADGDVANDTLVVNIVDDAPIAVNDTDSIAAGTYGPATGNVITDAAAGDAGDSDNGKDNVGADNATVSQIASNNIPANVDNTFTAGNLVVNGQYGVLTIAADGSYSYARNAGTPGGVNDVFTYTLLDGDGDTTTATLTISIADAPVTTDPNPVVLLDDDTETGGNAGGTGDQNPDTVNATGTLSGSGGDGPLTFTFTGVTQTLPTGFTGVVSGAGGTVLTISQGGTPVIVVTISNAATGTYTVEQIAPVDHVAGGNENDDFLGTIVDQINVTYRVSDVDGDFANGTLGIKVDDDTPTASVNTGATLDTLVLDETRPLTTETDGDSAPAGLATITAGFADNFNAFSYGADGAGTMAYSLVLTGTNVNSGLYALDAADILPVAGDGDGIGRGAQIVLNQSGNTITGSVGATNYFTISIDPATGIVTFTQLNNVWHANTGSDDDTSTLAALANSIVVRQTVTDSDGDVVTANIDVSNGVFQIEDDGPKFTSAPAPVSATNGNTAPVNAALNLNIGTDGYGQLLFNQSHDGDPAVDGDGNPLTLGGQPLFYQVNGNVLTAETAGGVVGFTITLNQNGTYTFDVNGLISNGTETSFTNLTSSAAGNVDFRLVGQDNDVNNSANTDIILSGRSEDGSQGTINTDSDSIGVDSQAVNPGAAVRIDLVENLEVAVVLPGDAGEVNGPQGFRHAGHVETRHFEQLIPQVQGSESETVSIVVHAILADDDDVYDNTPSTLEAGESRAVITKVYIDPYDGAEVSLDISLLANGSTTAIGTTGVSVTKNADGSVTFTGLQQGDQYGIDTATDFNAVIVESPDTNSNDFDLGIFTIGSTSAGTPIVQNFDITAIDRDGDPESATISTTINPVGTTATSSSSSSSSLSLLSTSGNKHLSHDQQRTADNSNNLLMAAVIGAAGLSSTSAAALSVNWQSHDNLVSDFDLTAFAPTQFDTLSLQQFDGGSVGFANELRELASPVDQIDAVRFEQDFADLSQFALTTTGADQGRMTDLLEATNMMPASHGQAGLTVIAPALTMPSAEALQAAGIVGGAQQGGAVEQILADALSYGAGAPTIDALLQGLPGGGEIGGLAAIDAVTSASGAGVPAWDMGFAGTSGPMSDMMFKMDASMLHQDAVQPAVNG